MLCTVHTPWLSVSLPHWLLPTLSSSQSLSATLSRRGVLIVVVLWQWWVIRIYPFPSSSMTLDTDVLFYDLSSVRNPSSFFGDDCWYRIVPSQPPYLLGRREKRQETPTTEVIGLGLAFSFPFLKVTIVGFSSRRTPCLFPSLPISFLDLLVSDRSGRDETVCHERVLSGEREWNKCRDEVISFPVFSSNLFGLERNLRIVLTQSLFSTLPFFLIS